MNMMNLRDFLFKDRPGEELGLRAESLVAQGLGFLTTALAILAFQNPIVIYASIFTNLVAIFTLIQAVRGRFNYLILFPIVTAFSICLVAIVEGKGSHDLIWVGTVGLFLLANIYSRKNSWIAITLGILMVSLFVGTGLAEMNNLIPNQYNTDIEHVLLGTLYLSAIMAAVLAVFHRHRALYNTAISNAEEKLIVSQQLERANLILDEQVKARTNELNQINNQLMVKAARLQAASDISQDLVRIFNEHPNELLSHAARLISEKLGFYHVGIFLTDTARGFAVLQAANSKGGQQMLAKHHQLKIGGTGIVGYVAQSGRPRIALDTGADAVYFNNPYLPETRSELSLPIKFGNSIIGVLDVQSTQSGAFTDEDTSTLMTIANQLAVLLQKKDEGTVSTPRSGKRPSLLTVWDKQLGYSFRSDGSIVSNASLETNPSIDRAIASGEVVAINRAAQGKMPMLAVPVKFRDQVIGVIHIESSEINRNWTEDEIMAVQSISDRAALALENARLFENATRRAEQEETISRVTTQIGSSTDFERIMQTTIQELGLALGASRSFIQIGTSSTSDEKA
jgi:GAF domain-containing protein